MTLQWRLTVLFFLLAAGAVAALGAGAYFVARERVYGSVDDSLDAQAKALTASIAFTDQPFSPRDVDASRRSLDTQAAQGAVFRIAGLDGSILYSSAGSTDAQPRVGLAPGYHTAGQGPRTRTLVSPVLWAGQPVALVETSASLAQADASLSGIRQGLVFGAIAVSALSAVAAYLVTGRAVQPVRDVASLAREIERTADFTRRLPDAPSAREMREMSLTFNRMIERVERMIQTQRSFLSDTSHELRRPLTILRTNIDVINDPALSQEERENVRREMCEVTDSMSELLSELLLLSRQDEESLQMERINLSALCAAAVKSVSHAHPERRYLSDLEPEVWTVGDRDRLSRLVTNLVQNAALYTEEGGEICVSLKARHGSVVLRVQDTGSGMPPEDVKHAFDRFYRGVGARRARPDGLGLGLAIVKQAVESHGGTISLDSRPGEGTEVTVALPDRED